MHAAVRGRRRLKIAVEFRVVGGEVRPATCHGPTCPSSQVRRVFLNAGPVPQIRSLQSAWNSSHFPKDNHRLRGNGSQSMAPTTKPSPPKCPARAKHAPICFRHSKSVSNTRRPQPPTPDLQLFRSSHAGVCLNSEIRRSYQE